MGDSLANKNVNSWKAPAVSARGQKSRERSALFRKKSKTNRLLEMIREDGERYEVEQPGRMNTTKHQTVLQLLERRALRLRKDINVTTNKYHDWSVDKTGTVDININQLGDIQRQEKLDMSGVSDKVLRVHGVMPGTKKEGITRLLYENCNSLSNRICGNSKLSKMKDLIYEWSADIVVIVEHRQNLHHKSNMNGWNQLFQRAEEDVRSVVAHNSHKTLHQYRKGDQAY